MNVADIDIDIVFSVAEVRYLSWAVRTDEFRRALVPVGFHVVQVAVETTPSLRRLWAILTWNLRT